MTYSIRTLLGVAAAFSFVLSALKLPSVTGSCSHPTGTGLGALLHQHPGPRQDFLIRDLAAAAHRAGDFVGHQRSLGAGPAQRGGQRALAARPPPQAAERQQQQGQQRRQQPAQPAPTVHVHNEVQAAPAVQKVEIIAMPTRETTTTIKRDGNDNIIKTIQTEQDAEQE